MAPSAEPAPSPGAPGAVHARVAPRELTLRLEGGELGPMEVVVTVPEHAPGTRLPVLIAFHGKGEALKGPRKGARGWVDDYALGRALRRLAAPPLTAADLEGFAEPARLAAINADLAARPFGGVVVVNPYTPDILSGGRSLDAARPMARWLGATLLPRLATELGEVADLDRLGIDGVSLGGRMALLVGLEAPERFRAIGTLQPAFDSIDASELARRGRRAAQARPGLRFRLLTSEDDYFLVPTRAIARAFQAAGLEPNLLIVPGPHDYAFNRGPGAVEMLLFHDRALRDHPTP